MITSAQLRERIDKAYPHLAKLPLDWAIEGVSRIRAREKEWADSFNETNDEIDRAYGEWRDRPRDGR